jgi:integrase
MASVYLKRGTWYLQVVDGSGRRRCIASTASTKTEAKRLASDLERRYERQRLGLEVADLPDGGGTVDELMEWWIDGFLQRTAGAEGGISSVRKHVVGSSLGALRLAAVTPGRIDRFLAEKEETLSPRSVNHLRGYLSRAFNLARRMERFPRPNPVADVPKRKVPKHLPDYLRPHEVRPLLAALSAKWQSLFATAIYTGMRKGELFALRKSDVDLAVGIIIVSRSHDRDTPKGGRAEAIPINTELRVYLEWAIEASRSELVFPGPGGQRLRRRRAERRGRNSAGLRWSGREDLNLRPFGPEPNALPGCATPRF